MGTWIVKGLKILHQAYLYFYEFNVRLQLITFPQIHFRKYVWIKKPTFDLSWTYNIVYIDHHSEHKYVDSRWYNTINSVSVIEASSYSIIWVPDYQSALSSRAIEHYDGCGLAILLWYTYIHTPYLSLMYLLSERHLSMVHIYLESGWVEKKIYNTYLEIFLKVETTL